MFPSSTGAPGRRLNAEIDFHHASGGDERGGFSSEVLLDAGIERHAAEPGHDRDSPARELMGAEPGFEAGVLRECRRSAESYPPQTSK